MRSHRDEIVLSRLKRVRQNFSSTLLPSRRELPLQLRRESGPWSIRIKQTEIDDKFSRVGGLQFVEPLHQRQPHPRMAVATFLVSITVRLLTPSSRTASPCD